MYRLILLVLLAACAAPQKTVTLGRYRPTDAPIYSNAQLDTQRLAGSWQQVATFGETGACKPGKVEISKPGAGLQIRYRLCQSGNDIQGAGAMTSAGPGRFTVPGQPSPWWVLWADVDYRTLVIGSPDGRVGFIINRGGFPPDRLTAAREILDFNSYDLRRLVVY